MKRMSRAMGALLVLTAVLAAACGDDGGSKTTSGGAGDGTVSATLKDFDLSLSTSTAPAGEVTFDITNDGPSVHEFVVFHTDLAADGLGTEDGLVDEDLDGLDLVDEAEDIEPDATTSLTVDLDPGAYVVLCNIQGHYEAGMYSAFTIE